MGIIADRLKDLPPYSFMELRAKLAAARTSGVEIISLAVGDPIEPTPAFIVETLREAALDPANHQYPKDEQRGMLEFREAVTRWYGRRYGVSLDPHQEILCLNGSKAAIHTLLVGMINPGDLVMLTDPAYPAYRANVHLIGAGSHMVPLLAENRFLPRLDDIPSAVCRKAKVLFLNYPHNPTGACADAGFFADLVAWAADYGIVLVHDNPYSEIVFSQGSKLSLLNTPGAKKVTVEFNSLSKTYNMTGWRIGMAVGNPDLIHVLSRVQENVTSGVFSGIQCAAIKALDEGDAHIEHMLAVYGRRRLLVLHMLADIGIEPVTPAGTFYLWLPVPQGMTSLQFATRLFDEEQVLVVAGTAYGEYGEGFFRISLTVPDSTLVEALTRMRRYFLTGPGPTET